jgi:hypothetical protein
MSDNRQGNFQALLTTGLAMGLGATLMTVVGSNDATAYPSGAVSYGANPVFSVGGSVVPGDVVTPLIAPTGSDLIITDVYFSSSAVYYSTSWNCAMNLSLTDTSGNVVGNFRVSGSGDNSAPPGVLVSESYNSGLRVSSGDSLILTATTHSTSSYDCLAGVEYTLSGYHAEP